MKQKNFIAILFSLFFLLALTGCKVDLYSNLQENEANEIMAVLLNHGIACDKILGKENRCSLRVEKSDVAKAIDLLKTLGYPREKFANIGEVFKKQGLVSSPAEERIRYIYALSQEIAETLSKIDGVLTSRVEIVLPENNPFKDTIKPSSAAIFIKYRDGSNIETLVPQIKKFVVNSIEGLKYDKVSVVLFPAEQLTPYQGTLKTKNVLGVEVTANTYRRQWILISLLLFISLLCLAAAGFMFWKSKSQSQITKKGESRDG